MCSEGENFRVKGNKNDDNIHYGRILYKRSVNNDPYLHKN